MTSLSSLSATLALAIVVLTTLWVILGWISALTYPLIRLWLAPDPERRSIELLVLFVLPLAVGAGMTLLLFTPWAESSLVDTHCHAKLGCGAHTPGVLDGFPGLLFLVIAVLLVIAGASLIRRDLLRSRRLVMRLQTFSRQSGEDYALIAGDEPIALSAGLLKPRIFVASALADQSSEREMAAILEHERAHGERRDNLRNLAASWLTGPFPPALRRLLLRDLRLASELSCDARAACKLSDPLLVAHTLVKVARLSRQTVSAACCGFVGSSLDIRVHALLSTAAPVERRWAHLVLLLAVLVGLIVPGTELLHHAVERTLSGLQGLVY